MCEIEQKYKLTYFTARGRAELSRLIFTAAGRKYDDVRIECDQWSALKPNTPFGQLPIMEIDGSAVLCQANAIAQYLANEFGLAGKSAFDKARAHMLVECVGDVLKPFLAVVDEQDETKKAELTKKFNEQQLPTYLASFEKLLKENNGGDGFYVGDSLTWADLCMLDMSEWLKILGADIKSTDYEKLASLVQRLSSMPNIAEWLAKRPVTPW